VSFEGVPGGEHATPPDNSDLIRDAAANVGAQLGEALVAATVGVQCMQIALSEARRAWTAFRAACERGGA
jgi:hypothetical protein